MALGSDWGDVLLDGPAPASTCDAPNPNPRKRSLALQVSLGCSEQSDWGELLFPGSEINQECAKAQMAEALRSSSDSEDDDVGNVGQVNEQSNPHAEPNTHQDIWWVGLLKSHVSQIRPEVLNMEVGRPIKVVSSCTGTCAEGAVLQASLGDAMGWACVGFT